MLFKELSSEGSFTPVPPVIRGALSATVPDEFMSLNIISSFDISLLLKLFLFIILQESSSLIGIGLINSYEFKKHNSNCK